MQTVIERYSNKAETYHRCRWPYAAAAIDELIALSGLTEAGTVADVGSGTGLLTRHFVGRAQHVYAIEPNSAMRSVAEQEFGGRASFQSLDARSDATGLADSSVDLAVVGRAIHWFPAASTRDEFWRILKPGGWLAVLAVEHENPAERAALDDLLSEKNGYQEKVSKASLKKVPLEYYFGHEACEHLAFSETQIEDWPHFLGRLLSYSPSPAPGDALYPRFERAARSMFDQLAVEGLLRINALTTVHAGPVRPL